MTELELIEKLTEALSANDQKLDNLIQAHNEKVESKKKEPEKPEINGTVNVNKIIDEIGL